MKKNKKIRKKTKTKGRKLIAKTKNMASDFLSSEEAKMIRKDIVKTAIALGLVAGAVDTTEAGHGSHASHGSTHADIAHSDTAHADYNLHEVHNDGATSGHYSGAHSDSAHSSVAHSSVAHGSHASHGSHGTHSSHGSGGWC